MSLLHISLAVALFHLVSPLHLNFTSSVKPKRTLSDQIYTHGETKPVVLLWDQTSPTGGFGGHRQSDLQAAPSTDLRSFAKPLALVSVQQPIQVFEQDTPKPIAAQQVLYEFQQTPTNAFSNVHVKQLFEPTDTSTENALDPTAHSSSFGGSFTQPSESQRQGGFNQNNGFNQQHGGFSQQHGGFSQQHGGFSQQHGPGNNNKHYPMASGYISSPATSESIATPVQHNLFTNHGQNTASFSYFNPTHPQPHQSQQIGGNHRPAGNGVGKYLYFNGKIVYQPNQLSQGSHNHFKQQSPNLALLQNQQKQNLPMINFLNRHYPQYNGGNNPGSPRGAKLTPPLNVPPQTYNSFKAPSPDQYQTINKPILTPPAKKKEEQEDDDAEEEDEEGEERSESQRQEEDEEPEGNDDEETESNDEENDDEEENHGYEHDFERDQENDQEDDDDYEKHYQESKRKSKVKHLEDDEHDDDDDKDNSRGASKQHTTYNKRDKNRKTKEKSPKKFETNENYGYKEKYSSSSKYRSPSKKNKKEQKYEKPKKQYKKVKYSKKEKPRGEVLEEESKIIPIVHKQKIYKERWYTIDNDKNNGRNE